MLVIGLGLGKTRGLFHLILQLLDKLNMTLLKMFYISKQNKLYFGLLNAMEIIIQMCIMCTLDKSKICRVQHCPMKTQLSVLYRQQ